MITGRALFAQLTGTSAVASMVSDRVYPDISPMKGRIFPEIVYDGEEADVDSIFDGGGNLTKQRVKISCRARTYDEAIDLGNAVIGALHDQTGTWGGLTILGAFYKGEEERAEPLPGTGDQSLLYVKVLDFDLHFRLQ